MNTEPLPGIYAFRKKKPVFKHIFFVSNLLVVGSLLHKVSTLLLFLLIAVASYLSYFYILFIVCSMPLSFTPFFLFPVCQN